jgi:hypothetical protein
MTSRIPPRLSPISTWSSVSRRRSPTWPAHSASGFGC